MCATHWSNDYFIVMLLELLTVQGTMSCSHVCLMCTCDHLTCHDPLCVAYQKTCRRLPCRSTPIHYEVLLLCVPLDRLVPCLCLLFIWFIILSYYCPIEGSDGGRSHCQKANKKYSYTPSDWLTDLIDCLTNVVIDFVDYETIGWYSRDCPAPRLLLKSTIARS